jgi:AraC-like DNA-binding protein
MIVAPEETDFAPIRMHGESPSVLYESDIYREWAPPPSWGHAVACLWEQRVIEGRVQRVIPDGHADLLFFNDGTAQVVGLADRVALPVLAAGARLVGVRLHGPAIGSAFRTPAFALLNRAVSADDLFGARGARRLWDPRRLDAWIRAVEPDRRAATAVELLEHKSVAATAENLGIARRHLQRVLQAEVGVAPQAYRRIRRLQRFVQSTDAGGELAVAAAMAGYADQSHLSRDVRRLSGLTPRRLVAERRQ